MRCLLLPCLLLACATCPAAVYRCEAEGRTLYTDRPCAAGARPHVLPAIGRLPAGEEADLAAAHDARRAQRRQERERADAAWLKAHAGRKAQAARVEAAIAERRVVKDMTPDQVRRALGSPDEVQRKDGRERWTWSQDGRRSSVVMEECKVVGTPGDGKKRREKPE